MEIFTIRKTGMDDIQTVLSIYDHARQFMKKHGNPYQWGDHEPAEELILQDIKAGKSYVCEAGGKTEAVFYFAVEEDPSYGIINGDGWLSDRPYGVIHRIASLGEVKGGATFCINYCLSAWPNIRIDTHEDNIPMQRLLAKNGFHRCGIICLKNGEERIGYQKELA